MTRGKRERIVDVELAKQDDCKKTRTASADAFDECVNTEALYDLDTFDNVGLTIESLGEPDPNGTTFSMYCAPKIKFPYAPSTTTYEQLLSRLVHYINHRMPNKTTIVNFDNLKIRVTANNNVILKFADHSKIVTNFVVVAYRGQFESKTQYTRNTSRSFPVVNYIFPNHASVFYDVTEQYYRPLAGNVLDFSTKIPVLDYANAINGQLREYRYDTISDLVSSMQSMPAITFFKIEKLRPQPRNSLDTGAEPTEVGANEFVFYPQIKIFAVVLA